jgi:hypothetical protein
MIRRTLLPLAVAALVSAPGSGLAQETPKPDAGNKEPAAERPGPRGTNLRVQLVISRYQGDKKLSSLPYTFVATTGGARVRMRMGVDTPVPFTSTASTSDAAKPSVSIQYRTVGTNIDCGAVARGDGIYQLNLGVENSSALPFEKGPSSGGHPPVVDANPMGSPLFRRFDINLEPWLRDGQSLQTIASTDPVTGEIVKIDVTVNVIR